LAANRIVVIDKFTRAAKVNLNLVGIPTTIIYNPDRKNIFGIVRVNPTGDRLSKYFEIDVDVSVNLVLAGTQVPYETVIEDKWGSLSSAYKKPAGIWLKTREYVRRPRENFNDAPEVDLIVKWQNDDVKDIFLYDFTGEQLSPTASVPYTGPKPFPLVTLNTKENIKPDRSGLSEYQQTIFGSLKFQLEKVDSQTDSQTKPTAIEIFIGSNSKNEGISESTLQMFKREYIDFTIISGANNASIIQFTTERDRFGTMTGYIILNNIAFDNFINDMRFELLNSYDSNSDLDCCQSEKNNNSKQKEEYFKQKQMIRIGEWTDYLVVDIFIRNYKGMFSKLFNRLYNTDSFRLVLEYKLNEVMQLLGVSGFFWTTINEIHLEENEL
jgi:hypothetical protein